MTKTVFATSTSRRIATRILAQSVIIGMSGLLTHSHALADTWGKSNKLSRVAVHAICGNPSTGEVAVDGKGCFCGNRLSYLIGNSAGREINCPGSDGAANYVPNYAHEAITASDMLQELMSILYGRNVEDSGFCAAPSAGVCNTTPEDHNDIGDPPQEEAYFVGHLVAALVGRSNCERAIQNYDPSEWAMDTALAELSEGGIKQLQNTDWKSSFEEGCRIDDYAAVWEWIKSQ